MNIVSEALAAIESGQGTYNELKQAVAQFKFTPIPVTRSLADLGEQWDYMPVEGSFRDTIEDAMWRGLITREQFMELRNIAMKKPGLGK